MAGFTSFVMLAAMRTGSNYLEESLNAVEGVHCHGEAFNPVFIGHPRTELLLGLTKEARDADPPALLERLRQAPGLNGFRYFPDHDPRVLAPLLADRSCAKIILNRNPAESYVSLKIARETGQWKLGDVRRRKEARARFDEAEFLDHLGRLSAFQAQVLRALQVSGQTGFYIDYDDLGDPEVLLGLLTFLGVKADQAAPARSIVPQNPGALADKVTNPREMAQALARVDGFALSRLPNFEPRRGPQVPAFVAARAAPLLFMPVHGGPVALVEGWLEAAGGMIGGFTQTGLRDWMRAHPGHRRFAVLRHPLLRAFDAFTAFQSGGVEAAMRAQIARTHKIAPELSAPAFAAFLRFLRANLNGQTPWRTRAGWASQAAVLQGFQQFAPPDLIAREDRLAEDLAPLCRQFGLAPPAWPADPLAGALRALAEDQHAALARQAYARDYLSFGFDDWS